jgi:hypothetical protein
MPRDPPPPAIAVAPIAVDAGAAPVADSAAPSADAGPAEPPQPKTTEVAQGTLIVRVTPWAQVVIDGVRRGEVDGPQSYRLPAGRHRLRFEHPRGNLDYTVNIEPGHPAVREFNAFKMR